MGAIFTWGFVAMNDAYYVYPLSEVSHPSETILMAKQSFSESNGSFTPGFESTKMGKLTYCRMI
jgi:hypothetical protein